jgi:hypothetical protein
VLAFALCILYTMVATSDSSVGLVCRWALVAVRGCWAFFVGAGFSFVSAELSFVGGGARSRAVYVRG